MGLVGGAAALDFRNAAFDLSVGEIETTDSPREVLVDLTAALEYLAEPIGKLLDTVSAGDPEFTAQAEKAKRALAEAARGVSYAADNV